VGVQRETLLRVAKLDTREFRSLFPTMIKTAVGYLPEAARRQLRLLRARIRYLGRARFCPVCQTYASSFQPWGLVRRLEARCPYCHSLERHRLVWLFFERRTNLLSPHPKRMLHVAPEQSFQVRLSRMKGVQYVSADLMKPRAAVRMDVTRIPYQDHAFDVIYCSHVLEHVAEDRLAMREFHRVLHPNGWAVLQVPIGAGLTFEDPSIQAPEDREQAFGQRDHVRRYGIDYQDRLIESGFFVRRIAATEFSTDQEIEKMRLDPTECIFFCTKSEES
jgi:SAM-dependent methyltransferase